MASKEIQCCGVTTKGTRCRRTSVVSEKTRMWSCPTHQRGPIHDDAREIANCNVLATEARATAAEAVVARVATREFAERYLAEWVKPYFGDDATDAAACVQRAMTAALAPTTTTEAGDGHE